MTKKDLQLKIQKAKKASFDLLKLNAESRKKVLKNLAQDIQKNQNKILTANQKDIKEARKEGRAESFIERLSFSPSKIQDLVSSIKKVADLSDCVGEVMEKRTLPNGLKLQKIKTPLGLLAMIYESRPNVTVDAFCLAWKSANAVILKGGKEIRYTNNLLVGLIKKNLKKYKINPDIILDVSGVNRRMGEEIFINQNIDCLIPRGGKGLINFVRDNARIPVIITGASVVHAFVDDSADLDLACKIVFNSKMRRVSICNTLDTLLLHRKIYKNFLEKFICMSMRTQNFRHLEKYASLDDLLEIRADARSYEILKNNKYQKLKKIKKTDYDTEYLDFIMSVRVVDDFKQALDHVRTHSLGHSEAIITKNKNNKEIFFREIDAACLYHNTSTQFSDGGEFGLGAEIGISTQKLHVRGPFAHESLVTYKYVVESEGRVRS